MELVLKQNGDQIILIWFYI